MMLNRRRVLSAAAALVALPKWTLARDVPSALMAYEHESGGRIGLYAENLRTGKKIAWREHERFVMCSTFKASLAALVLERVDRAQDQLGQMIPYGPDDVPDWHAPVAKKNLSKGSMSVADMCEAVVEYSDNTCANLLLARIGGPAALTAFWRSIGDHISRLDHNEPKLNLSPPGDPHDTTTPITMARNLSTLVLGNVLSTDSRERLTSWMLGCKTGDNRLRGGLPRDWKIGDKTGNNGDDAAGDIAVAWPNPGTPVLICAYTQGGSPSAPQIEALFAAIGHIVGLRLA